MTESQACGGCEYFSEDSGGRCKRDPPTFQPAVFKVLLLAHLSDSDVDEAEKGAWNFPFVFPDDSCRHWIDAKLMNELFPSTKGS